MIIMIVETCTCTIFKKHKEQVCFSLTCWSCFFVLEMLEDVPLRCVDTVLSAQTPLTVRSVSRPPCSPDNLIQVEWINPMKPAHWLSTLSCSSINLRRKYLWGSACVCVLAWVGRAAHTGECFQHYLKY